jgi:hypothetical protein
MWQKAVKQLERLNTPSDDAGRECDEAQKNDRNVGQRGLTGFVTNGIQKQLSWKPCNTSENLVMVRLAFDIVQG